MCLNLNKFVALPPLTPTKNQSSVPCEQQVTSEPDAQQNSYLLKKNVQSRKYTARFLLIFSFSFLLF